MVMGHLHVLVQARAYTYFYIRSLVIHRVLRVDTHHAALGILTVERTLRATQHVHAVQHEEMVVERRLRHQRNVVVIHAHGRVVDA